MPKCNEGINIERNLDLMAKLKSSDRIGAPKLEGIFKKNGFRVANDSILRQSGNIKSVFEAALSQATAANPVIIGKALAAQNGLKNMLSDYQKSSRKQSQSDELKKLIDEITDLIYDTEKRLGVTQILNTGESATRIENIAIAKNAINYLKSLGIVSNNIRGNGHYKGDLETFLGRYLRQEHRYTDQNIVSKFCASYNKVAAKANKKIIDTAKARKMLNDIHDTRREILNILRSGQSSQKRKTDLKSLLERKKNSGDYVGDAWIQVNFTTTKPDEQRIRLARKSIKFKTGNCYEKSAIIATHMIEATRGSKQIYWVASEGYDHCFAILADKGQLSRDDVQSKPTYEWPGNAVIVDGWTGDYYNCSEIRNKAGIFKMHKNIARKGIVNGFDSIQNREAIKREEEKKNLQKEFGDSDMADMFGSSSPDPIKAIDIYEDVTWPPVYDPSFRLAVASLSNKSYRGQIQASQTQITLENLVGIATEPELMASSLILIVNDNDKE